MSIWSNIWGTVVMHTTRGAADIAGGTNLGYRYRKDGNVLVYRKHRTYKSKLVQEASRLSIQAAINEINQLYPNYLKKTQREKRKITEAAQRANQQQLIKNQTIQIAEGFGKVEDTEKKKNIYATDKYGNLISEALMLYYIGETEIDAGQYYDDPIDPTSENYRRGSRKSSNASRVGDNDTTATRLEQSFTTKYVCHIDLAPEISLSSTKNLILTPVQGRDYSRKELVAGGDLTFSVNGSIICDQPGVYPTQGVQKFVMNMQYGGILKVHHFQFAQFGVTQVLIKDWNLGSQECKNIQPYSFTCVAVEPDEEIQLKDTIKQLNQDLAYDDYLNPWQRLLMDEKFKQIAQNAMTNMLNSSITTLTDLTSGNI